MIKAIQKCESIFESLGYPYDWHNYAKSPPDQLPDRYITYSLVDEPGRNWAEGEEINRQPKIQVSFRSRNRSDFLTIPNEIEAAFKAAGFMRFGGGDLPHDETTGHDGTRMTFIYYE